MSAIGHGHRRVPARPTYLVTGATSGIGGAIATQLAATGARVLAGARTTGSAEAAIRRLRAGAPEAEIDAVTADLSEMRQVRALAEQVQDRATRLDGVILNAAEVRTHRALTREGFETNFATNYLSGFLLTQLLLPLLRCSAPARVVTLSSSNHAHIKQLDLEALPTGDGFKHTRSYSTTKLLNVLFTTELARRARDSGVTANAADPGFVRTNLGRHTRGAFGLFLKLVRPFQDTPANAASTPVYLATAPDVASISGGYFAKCRPATTSALAQDATTAQRLWDLSASLLIGKRLAAAAELN